jgi:hypothetical protein
MRASLEPIPARAKPKRAFQRDERVEYPTEYPTGRTKGDEMYIGGGVLALIIIILLLIWLL